jgi:hypothetical protein
MLIVRERCRAVWNPRHPRRSGVIVMTVCQSEKLGCACVGRHVGLVFADRVCGEVGIVV